jgi:hypothetical protein
MGDQILLSNLSPTRVVVLDPKGRPFVRVPSGESRTWHDRRVISTGEPPGGRDPRVVKNWRIPGRVGDKRFEIVGFLGWVPPPQSEDENARVLWFAGGALALVALSAVAAYLLGRGRPS